MAQWDEWISAPLAVTEVIRATRTWLDRNEWPPHEDERVRAEAANLLQRLVLIESDRDVLEQAGNLDPVSLRSLDAIHLATALQVKDDIDGLVTYDRRLAEAAGAYGLKVLSPA